MDGIIKSGGGLPVQPPAPRWPNMIVLPREIRDAIPEHSARALVFDRVDGAVHDMPAAIAGLGGAPDASIPPRAVARLHVHETGKLDGAYAIDVDLDPETMRALGRFLIDLAARADAERRSPR